MRHAPIAALMLVAVLAGGTWLATRFLSSDAATTTSPPPNAASIGARSDDRSDAVISNDRTLPLAASRAAEANPRLARPEPELVRRLARRGHEIEFGVVIAPDGAPCEEATVLNCGRPVATTDRDGAWRAELVPVVSKKGVYNVPSLMAYKAGVGIAWEPRCGRDGRVDFALERGVHLRGRALRLEEHTPVANAHIDALIYPNRACDFPFVTSTTTNAEGHFELSEIPPGRVLLHGRADGLDSNGYDAFNTDESDDREVEYWLAPMIGVHGRFDPWPPRGIALDGPAQVVAVTTTADRTPLGGSQMLDDDGHTFRSDVRADGRFDLAIGSSNGFDFALRVGSIELWKRTILTGASIAPVDLGAIGLPSCAQLRGRLDLPHELFGLGLVMRANFERDEPGGDFECPIDPDGTFQVTGIFSSGITGQVELGGTAIARIREGFKLPPQIEPGRTLDVGPLLSAGTVIAGRIVDDEGAPIACASLLLVRIDADGRETAPDQCWESQADGRYCIIEDFDDCPRWRVVTRGDWQPADAPIVARAEDRWCIAVDTFARARQLLPVQLSSLRSITRRDLVLERKSSLRGLAHDAKGQALVDWYATIEDADHGFLKTVFTESDGSFAVDGLDEGAYSIALESPRGDRYRFKSRRLQPDPIALDLADADETPVAPTDGPSGDTTDDDAGDAEGSDDGG